MTPLAKTTPVTPSRIAGTPLARNGPTSILKVRCRRASPRKNARNPWLGYSSSSVLRRVAEEGLVSPSGRTQPGYAALPCCRMLPDRRHRARSERRTDRSRAADPARPQDRRDDKRRAGSLFHRDSAWSLRPHRRGTRLRRGDRQHRRGRRGRACRRRAGAERRAEAANDRAGHRQRGFHARPQRHPRDERLAHGDGRARIHAGARSAATSAIRRDPASRFCGSDDTGGRVAAWPGSFGSDGDARRPAAQRREHRRYRPLAVRRAGVQQRQRHRGPRADRCGGQQHFRRRGEPRFGAADATGSLRPFHVSRLVRHDPELGQRHWDGGQARLRARRQRFPADRPSERVRLGGPRE